MSIKINCIFSSFFVASPTITVGLLSRPQFSLARFYFASFKDFYFSKEIQLNCLFQVYRSDGEGWSRTKTIEISVGSERKSTPWTHIWCTSLNSLDSSRSASLKLFRIRKHIIDCVKSDLLDQAKNCDNLQQHSRHAQNLPMIYKHRTSDIYSMSSLSCTVSNSRSKFSTP